MNPAFYFFDNTYISLLHSFNFNYFSNPGTKGWDRYGDFCESKNYFAQDPIVNINNLIEYERL